ncbi:glycosyl transferase family 1 [Sphingomonas spermidinifaciens]|uniref:Glycosyl transferase family 1 n=1 Tax=Sphingomonas spermidinifaciens TaxID=1141889 RepID=A0A2A4B558_9SPHN|nr:glycosyltransferase family 4 protein [Sphingomonas spermidinifaciens]PCD03082.1 glycosyl transferase family 1 [Sphingomonas spermidinifaciens]
MTVNILHLHSSFDLGGKEARAVRLMNAFGKRARHTIVSGVEGAYGARGAITKGVAHEIAQDPPPLTGKPSVARYEAIARYMRRFDLVLTYNWGAVDGVMAARVFPKGAPPVVHHEDGFNADEAERLNRMRNYYRRVALGAAHALVVPSERLEKVALTAWKQPAARVHRISNGIPTRLYAGRPDPRAIPGFVKGRDAVVGTLAGLRAVKDLPLMVRAVGGVPQNVRLVIVGEGPERQAIENQAAAMFMHDRVHLPGFLAEPHRYIGLFDLFMLTSLSEQQPISVMEAMAAGLPIVAPRVGDIASMVAPENLPYLADGRSEIELRDRLAPLVADPDLRAAVGAANRARASALFDEGHMIGAYTRLYEGAMRRPGVLQP